MRIEAVTVCVNYADFLAETLPLNLRHFDNQVIVTTPDDIETQRVCELNNVQCVTTNAFYDGGGFNKAKGINAGLAQLKLDGWVVHIDADMALPAQARQILERCQLNPEYIYGLDRHLILGYDQWAAHKQGGKVQQALATCIVNTDHYKLGGRLNVPKMDGWMPLGFFQLWNPQVSGVDSYPDEHNGADKTDTLFATTWPRSKRQFIPEMIAWHLESEDLPMGANWQGRTTKRFQPTQSPDPKRAHTHLPLAAGTTWIAVMYALLFANIIAALVVIAVVLAYLLIWWIREHPPHRKPKPTPYATPT